MRRAVVHPLNGALPVLEVVDGLAVQLDRLHHAPCVADDLDGGLRVELQIEIIVACPHERLNVLGGIDPLVYRYRAVREVLCGSIVNAELGILAVRVELAALEQQRRVVLRME